MEMASLSSFEISAGTFQTGKTATAITTFYKPIGFQTCSFREFESCLRCLTAALFDADSSISNEIFLETVACRWAIKNFIHDNKGAEE